ncbi:MAG: hypothetical protein ACR2P2_04480 [Nakamurella sp.]
MSPSKRVDAPQLWPPQVGRAKGVNASAKRPSNVVLVSGLRGEMTDALGQLNTALPTLDWVDITDRASGAITLNKYEAAPEPRNLRRVKAEVQRRWGRWR